MLCTGYNCICQTNFKTLSYFGGDAVSCEACGVDEVTSSDGFGCVECGTISVTVTAAPGVDSECPSCPDPTSSIVVDKELSGDYLTDTNGKPTSQCLTCTNLTLPSADNTKCERCSNIIYTAFPDSCVCNPLIARMSGGYCFKITDLPNQQDLNLKVMLSGGDNSVTSLYLESHLEAAYTLCKIFQNVSSCELLMNLCAANFASDSSYTCVLYRRDQNTGAPLAKTNWPANLPWLYYATNEQELASTAISTSFSLKKDSIDNRIRLVVAVYKLNGEYLGIQSVRNGLLQLCPNTQEKLNAAWSFGAAYAQSCELNVHELMERETLFYDPYLEYTSSTGASLYPIPVLVTNYLDPNGDQVNDGDDQSKWQLTRRFFLVDTELFPGSTRPQYVRYVSDMELNIKLQENKDGKIYTPYLKITYSFEEDAEIDANSTVKSSFAVTYELNSAKFDNDFTIALSVLGVSAALFSAIQTWTWARRTGEPGFPLVVMKFLAFSAGTLSNSFLIVLVSISIWWLVFFKRQDVVYLLPVTDAQETLFGNFLIVAVVLKFIDIFHLFARQVKVDIFLIDWERPKAVNKENQSGDQKSTDSDSSVSIWRTYFVANEWNEIQTTRQICPLFQLIVTLLFLKVVGFENLCTKDRESTFVIDENSYIAPHSNMFRFGIMAAIWFISAALQWIFFTLIWERFIEDKVRQFVDLCSMANISVFIMENGQFGYYIHGRSPHGIADTGMKEMFRQLKRETENLCAHRGLEPNTDAQTFRMALQPGIRYKYDSIFTGLRQEVQSHTTRDSTDKQFLDLSANSKLNKFFSDFLDHSLEELDYVVKDKAWYESLLNAEFEMVIDKGFFYNDNGHSFDQVLFYGNELTLTTFEVLLFGLVDMYFQQGYVLSAVLVYFMSLFFRLIRDGLGRKNLAEKTLVDERFLI
ncbi:TMEM67 [Bugula neritina]|uniref:TMEM67 n=1 Tax=Bugula neritina TaxID=10212 RepID=A0A7J7JAJ5_BUGNE|nr:TMEM67 [Bugula neritina]